MHLQVQEPMHWMETAPVLEGLQGPSCPSCPCHSHSPFGAPQPPSGTHFPAVSGGSAATVAEAFLYL